MWNLFFPEILEKIGKDIGDLDIVKSPKVDATFAIRLKNKDLLENQKIVDERFTIDVQFPWVNIKCSNNYLVSKINSIDLLEFEPKSPENVICFDFSSPNIAKHLAFHHIRSTSIGNCLANVAEKLGYPVKRLNFLGDWGTSFAKLITAFKEDPTLNEKLDKSDDKIGFLADTYTKISKKINEDERLAEELHHWSLEMETSNDEELISLWTLLRDISLNEFSKLYKKMGITFDSFDGEAHYRDKCPEILESLVENDEGTIVIPKRLTGLKNPIIVRRKDGASLYITRDIAACLDRFRSYNFKKCCYVVDSGQSLHFVELFKCMELISAEFKDRLQHIEFGQVLMWNEIMKTWEKTSSRNGRIVSLLDVFDEAKQLILPAIETSEKTNTGKKPLTQKEKENISEKMGIGSVVFNTLKFSRKSNIKFKLNEITKIDGDTGPYLQYALARLFSILEVSSKDERYKNDILPESPTYDYHDEEVKINIELMKLRESLLITFKQQNTSYLCGQVLQLCHSVSSYISLGNTNPDMRVLVPDLNVRAARLGLIKKVKDYLTVCFQIIGLEVLERVS